MAARWLTGCSIGEGSDGASVGGRSCALRCIRRHANSKFELMPTSNATAATDVPGSRLLATSSHLNIGLCFRRRRLLGVSCRSLMGRLVVMIDATQLVG